MQENADSPQRIEVISTPAPGVDLDKLAHAAGSEMVFFHVVYTFLSAGIFIIFAIETWKTMLNTYDGAMKKIAERKARKAAAKSVAKSSV